MSGTPFIQTQPRLSRFTLRGFLSLPRRLCSPPAAVGKVRSFGLTPIFDVRLEDVLDRKHLPPLSLKDFEEWLLYVEQSVENLYFVLWLREYSAKYDRWIAKVRARDAKARHGHGNTRGHALQPPAAYRVAWSTTTPTSPALALFFSRARETFLVPGAPYELSLPPALLDALAVVNGHPDPAVLAPARAHVEDALRASLARCVRAAYSNVGAYRAACGIVAGIFITLCGTVPPLVVNFVRAQSRWERLVILPGLWLGLTVLIASLRGICMMIYIFGDFRQLRKFELVRPPPPTSLLSSTSLESSSIHTPTTNTIVAPARPVQALTAPPKIAIRIPSRTTPTLSYGTMTSLSTDVSFPGTTTQSSYTSTSYSHAPGHMHTISISSLKSRGGASSLVFPHGYGRNSAVYADSETQSVPGYVSSDDEDEDEDGESFVEEEDEHGIYISPAMCSPDTNAEDDPAVVNAALALIASEAASGSEGVAVATAGAAATSEGNCEPSTSSAAATTTQQVVQIPTAPFIPAYPYSDDDSVRALKHRARSLSAKSGGGEREADLEAGGTVPVPSLTKPFDFDALPIPIPPAAPTPAVPTPLAVATRPRAPDYGYLDVCTTGLGDEKVMMLPSPSSASGYGLGGGLGLGGVGVGTGTGTGTEYDPISPAMSDDAAGLCEKGESSDAWRSNVVAGGERRWPSVTRRLRSSIPAFPMRLRLPHPFALLRPTSPYPSFPSPSFSPPYSEKAQPSKNQNTQPPSSKSGKGKSMAWRTRCALESRVPAFGPVTRVLAPEVARAQWEIVVRAACLAVGVGVVVGAGVVALPVPGS